MIQFKDKRFNSPEDVSWFCETHDVKVQSICFDNNSNTFVLFYTIDVQIPPRPRSVFSY